MGRSLENSSAKPIQIILARQLAGSLAMPILIVDTEGALMMTLSERRPVSRTLRMRCRASRVAAREHHLLIAQAIEETKPAYRVAPGIEGTVLNCKSPVCGS